MVPEGLLPTLTLSLVLATQRMARRSVLIRYLPSVEALGSTTVICTDKTGTLTQNRMTVRRLFVGGAMHSPAAIDLGRVFAERYRAFFLTAQLCHDLRDTGERGGKAFLGDPMEIALVDMARQILPAPSAYPRLDEIPFDADRMRLSAVHAMPEGPTLYCKGALESVLPLCSRILLGRRRTSARPRAAGADSRSPRNNGRARAFGSSHLPTAWWAVNGSASAWNRIWSLLAWSAWKIRPGPRYRKRCADAARRESG